MTIGSVNVNFKVVLPQGHTAEDVEMAVLSMLSTALANVAPIVEFDTLPGTQTKVDPFTPARVIRHPMGVVPQLGGGSAILQD